MKKIALISLITLLFFSNLISQAPNLMSYQAVIWDASGNLVSEKMVSIKLSILQGSVNGTSIYYETHRVQTNVNGLVSLMIGGGINATGKISDINWGLGSYFLKTETDPTGGGNYSISGISQLMSVPYSFFSGMTGNIQTTKLGLPGQVLKLDEQGKPFWSGSSYPIVSNQMVSLTSCTAGITGNVTSDGGSPVTSRGVVWSTSPNPTILSSIVIEGNGIGSFSTTLPNLAPNITYFIKAFATNEVGTGYGSEIKITTFSGTAKPTVTTNPISDVTFSTAISGGIVTGDCGSVVTARGVVWSTSPNPTISLNTKTINGTGTGSFVSNLTGLTPNTIYYVKAYATNNAGTGYGDEVTFESSQNCGFKPVLSGTFVLCKGNSTTLATNVSGGIWSSNDPSIAAINSTTGNVKGLNKGCAKIDYLLKGTNGCPDVNSSIFVTIDSIEEPNFTEVNLPICIGKEARIRGEINYFSIINPSLVDIDNIDLITDPSPDDPCLLGGRTINNYILTGKKNGFTNITMSYGGKNSCPIKSITIQITVLSCSKPTVTTLNISSLTSTTASLGGNVTSDGGAPIISRGVVWSTSPNPTISLNTKTTNGTGTGSFTSSLTGLTPNTTYYVKAYATNSAGTGYGNEVTFKTSQNCSPNPILSGSDILCIGSSTAISSNILGGIWSSSNPNVATVFQSLGIVNAVSEGFTELTYLIKGINGCADVSSKFPISIISKETKLDITGSNFVCEGNTTFLYSTIYPGYLKWSIQDTFIAIDGCVFQGGPAGPTPIANQICIKGKKSGLTTITFKYGGSGVCPELSVTRQIIVGKDKPTVTRPIFNDITSNSAKGIGEVIAACGTAVTARGIVWSTSPNTTIALTTKTSAGTGTGSFTSTITGLSPNTTYYYRAYATNSTGTGYSDESTFTTTIAVALPIVSTISVSSITPTTASSGGNVTSDGGSLVSSRGIVWSIYSRPTISLSTKTNDGTGLGSFSSSLIGLSPNTTYYVRAYATNSVGTGYGEELRFMYNSLPTVVTISIDTFESIFLKYTGKVVLDGGSPIIERGVVLNNCGKPTLPFNQNDLAQHNKDRLFTDSHEHKSHNDIDTNEISRKNLEIKSNEKKRFEKIKVQFSESSIEQEINVEIENGLVFWSDDILLFSEKEFDLIKLEKGNIHSIKSLRWPNGIIPYTISNNHSQTNDILEAIKITNNQTNINLIPRTNETNYVEFVEEDKNRCFAIIGMAGGRQRINVNNCGIASIIHEIGHALGMWHEHQRNDRDDFITIQYENIIDEYKYAFDKKLGNILSIGQYDYKSIMHYGAFAFTKNSMPTISIKSPPAAPGTSIGQRSGLSVGDIFAINSIYRNKNNCVSIYYPNDKGLGDFSGFLYNLNPNQKFYLRTYATNSTGTGYGNEISFTTKLGLPILSTLSIDSLSSINVKSGGNITLDGGSSIIARGVVWSTYPLPTIELSTKTTDGIGKGTFLSSITNLKPNTAYYLRAYATNESGTGYGNEITFTTSRIGHPCSNAPNIKDIDGNTYNTLQIGNHCWTKENLRVTKFNDGTSILLDTSGGTAGNGIGQTWSSLTKGARTIYAHSQTNLTTYGYLYNWYAARGIATGGSINYKNICPKGWHVPNDSEWTIMIQVIDNTATSTALGLQSIIAGSKMKSLGTTLWAFPNAIATNESGFSALPSGNRFFEGNFNSINIHAIFWSASESYNNFAWSRLLNVYDGSVIRGYQSMSNGYSIRCLKD